MAGSADPVRSVTRWLRLRIRIILWFTVIPEIDDSFFSESLFYRVNCEGIQWR